jgi:hypothetical protein
MLKHPRIEMLILCPIPRLQQALSTTLFQLPLQHIIGPVCLRHVPLQRVLILHFVVVSIPVRLAGHEAETRQEEEGPFVEVDFVLLAGARTEGVGFVIVAQEVVDHGAGFPGDDADVGVFEGGDTTRARGMSVRTCKEKGVGVCWVDGPILIDLQEHRPLNAVVTVAKFSKPDVVGQLEGFEEDGDFVGVRACVVSMQSKRLHVASHFGRSEKWNFSRVLVISILCG